MALTFAKVELVLSWSDTTTPVTGGRTVKNTDSLSLVSSPAVATYNRRLRTVYTVASSGTQLIDLASFTDPYTGATITLTKATGIIITGTQAFTLGPNNAANPLQWFWGGTTQTLRFNANEGFAALYAVTFSTGSKLLLTNTGASSGTFDVCIIGGT